MDSTVIVDVTKDENVIALLEDGKLVELQRESRDNSCALGDIFIGKVTKVDRGLNAAFANIGTDRDAFIPFSEITPFLSSTTALLEKITAGQKKFEVPFAVEHKDKGTNIENYLKKGQRILLQVSKEKINTKGATVTTELSFAGRNMVLLPFSEGVSISKKITDEFERNRLSALFESIKPKGFKIVVRTFAFGKNVADLDRELRYLLNCWRIMIEKLGKAKNPQRLHAEPDRTVCFLRESFDETYKNIIVNHQPLYREVSDYLDLLGVDKDQVSLECVPEVPPVFDKYGVTKQIKSLFGRTVTYKSGAYLVIDETEAMNVIDVNSGTRSRKSTDQDETAFEVNMSAAVEIARQLRLRDMGGIIVIDFIDIEDPTRRNDLFKKMEELMQHDKAAHTILPLSKFSVMQITRQRVRPVVTVKTEEVCPCCNGSGKSEPSLLLIDQIEDKFSALNLPSGNKVYLHVHPFVAAYLKKGAFGSSIATKWKKKYGYALKIIEEQQLPFLQYVFYDHNHQELFVE